MAKIIVLNTLEPYLEKLKKNGGMWKIDANKFAIKHLEVEKLAEQYGIETDITLVHCDLKNSCAVVKVSASFQSKKYYSLGEVSPHNNTFPYPVAVAEKRAVDRAVLKSLNIHGEVYSDVELSNTTPVYNENTGMDLNHATVIMQRITSATHQGKLNEVLSDSKEYLTKLKLQDSQLCLKVMNTFKNKQRQLS